MKVTDPVCGMNIDSEKAHASETRDGRNYYFCSMKCHSTFKTDPGKFAAKARQPGDETGHAGHDHHD